MDEKMEIAIVQHDIVAESVERTLSGIESLLAGVEAVDLVVLPEMFATGFDVDDASVAEPASGGAVLRWMQSLAAARRSAVEGSVAVDDNGLRNRHYFVYPDGTYRYYDKRHLFSFGGENRLYRQGVSPCVVEYKGVRLLLQTCYDLRFPVFSRNCGGCYDVAVYVASWPKSRISAWDTLLQARAIENLAYVVAVNRVGTVGKLEYDGHSRVVDYLGRTVAGVADSEEGVAVAEIDLSRLRAFRRKFPALDDADRFTVDL
jgi:omega-amidase